MAMSELAIELADVDLSLGEGVARVHILHGVSMTIGCGEAVGLVGASGSGKSTLLMIVAGLERPDRGRIVVDGQRIDAMGEDKLARFRGQRIGIVVTPCAIAQARTGCNRFHTGRAYALLRMCMQQGAGNQRFADIGVSASDKT